MNIHIRRSRRRTISLEVATPTLLVVRAPLRVPGIMIRRFIAREEQWILRQVERVKKKARALPQHTYEEGDAFLYLGKYYPLRFTEKGSVLRFEEDVFLLPRSKKVHGGRLFRVWYTEMAYTLLRKKTEACAFHIHESVRDVRISNARTRWGSCSSDGRIRYTWRLLLAPEDCLDYVVAHEVSHLLHKNHGKRFWACVEKLCPHWKTSRRWLRDHGHTLSL